MSVLEERPLTASRTTCPRCSSDVLAAPFRAGGLTVYLDPEEITPRWRCPSCLSKKQLNYDCPRCGTPVEAGDETRWVGENLDGVLGVAVDEDGTARPFLCGADDRLSGEAIYRAHRCSVRTS